jgi:hypothetical protein
VLVWVLVGTLVTLPYIVAALWPPPGRTFVGTFHWIDDFHNYVSFVQQAEDGHILFRNKLLLREHRGVLVNLEWWTTGVLSRLIGRNPFLAYRILALAALAGLLHAVDRALGRLGRPPAYRLPALMLVAFGGGLGGLLFELTDRPVFRCADLAIGYFPFVEALSNPHWLLGTWLALETLLAASSPGRLAAFGTALGLVRPYDLVLISAVLGLSALAAGPRSWLGRGLPLLGLLPVCAYDYWAFYSSGVFPTYTVTPYASPPLGDLAWALAPALGLAVLGGRAPAERTLQLQLWTWTALAIAVLVLKPATFALQFAVGCGLPLLVLAAFGLPRFRPALAWVAAALLSTTALVAWWIVLRGRNEPWYVPSERRDAALALRPACRTGDLVFAPPDIGLYAAALTACHPYSSHEWEPDHAVRSAEVRGFYTTMGPDARRGLLEKRGVRHLLLPGDPGPSPRAWLGESHFRRGPSTGRGAATITVYTRER